MLNVAGGRVLQPDGSVERADVQVDRKTGTIAAVGECDGADETLDASGALVVPGLVNAHTHTPLSLLRGYSDDEPLESWLAEDIQPVEAHLTRRDVTVGAELGALEMIESGTTAFADMYCFVSEIAEVVESAGLRAYLGRGILSDEDDVRSVIADTVALAEQYDGAADGRIRTALMPHGLYSVDEAHLVELRERADDAELPLHFHANETEAEVDTVREKHGARPIEAAAALDLLGPDAFVAHGVHLDSVEIDLLAASGTGVAHCPASNMKLASGIAPVQRLLDAGVTVGLGTDSAASNNNLDLFDEMRAAAMVGKLEAGDAAAIDASTAVHLATAGSASLLGFDSGRIKPGANADLAVVDLEQPHLTPRHDPVSHLVYAARGSDVRHTVCDGQVLMCDREVLVLDEAAVRTRAERQARDLLDRAGVE
jgi:5-methylthioadenosine/S-adenosylhomocysteine deaminase